MTAEETPWRGRVDGASALVLSVSTNDKPGSRNLERTLSRLGYRYALLGRGLRFGGWAWRTAQYLRAVTALDDAGDDRPVVLCDADDVLFLAPADELRDRFRLLSSETGAEVVISGEPYCFAGQCSKPSVRAHVGRVMSERGGRDDPLTRFPCAGLVTGTARALRSRLAAIVDDPDDQYGYIRLMVDERDRRLVVDHGNALFVNITRKDRRWRVDDAGRLIGGASGRATPIAAHFPGRNVRDYNRMGAAICDRQARRLETKPRADAGFEAVRESRFAGILARLIKDPAKRDAVAKNAGVCVLVLVLVIVFVVGAVLLCVALVASARRRRV